MKAEVLIIGGGLAGSAAAIHLANNGRQVRLIERAQTPQHKVCGEFLSDEALHYLQLLGIDVSASGAVPLQIVRMVRSGSLLQQPLPFRAMSLTRRQLDETLLAHAERAGVTVLRGRTVQQLRPLAGKWHASLSNGDQITADAVFLATGKHDLRGHPRPPGRQQGMVAFKMYWRLSAEQSHRLGAAVELLTYSGGYAGLQPVEGGSANLCCLVEALTLRRVGSNWPGLLHHMRTESPHLRARLQGAEPLLLKPLTITSLPYGFVRNASAGIWYLGDQAAVIPSFTGDGMSLALHSAVLASRMFLEGHTADVFQRKFKSEVQRQIGFATAVSQSIVKAPLISLLVPKLWPGAIAGIARHTRIAEKHLLT